jgi:polygalacturonase
MNINAEQEMSVRHLVLSIATLLLVASTRGHAADPPASAPTTSPSAGWSQTPQIRARIKAPVFPDRQIRITDYGATAGADGDATEALRQAIAACNAAGGGRVVVPAGIFNTGAVHLKSNVNLHLEDGATLLFKQDPTAYLPAVFTRFEGMEFYNYSPFIYAFEQENIAITGSGTIDGQASRENWWGWTARQGQSRNRLASLVDANAPVDQRQFGDGSFMRPVFIQPYRCRNVLIEGIAIRRSPMWEINPVLCTNVIVRGLNIVSHGPNNDGCNPESSKDVLIEDCLFDTGDDCIAIKSGRNNDGRRIATASENIIIRRCTMKDGHGGVTIGSEISGDCRNVFVEDCTMDSPNLDRVLRMKSNALRGGTIENIFMRNITVGQVANEVLQIDFVYERNPQGDYRPVARNILMDNITVKQTPRIMSVVGIPGSQVNNVQIINSTFENVRSPDVIRDAQDVKVLNSRIERQQPAASQGR